MANVIRIKRRVSGAAGAPVECPDARRQEDLLVTIGVRRGCCDRRGSGPEASTGKRACHEGCHHPRAPDLRHHQPLGRARCQGPARVAGAPRRVSTARPRRAAPVPRLRRPPFEAAAVSALINAAPGDAYATKTRFLPAIFAAYIALSARVRQT